MMKRAPRLGFITATSMWATARRHAATSSGLASGEVGGPAGTRAADGEKPAPEQRTVPRPTRVSQEILSSWEKIEGLADHEPQPRAPPRTLPGTDAFRKFVAAQEGMETMEQYHYSLVAGNAGPTLGQSLRKEDSTLEGWIPPTERSSQLDKEKIAHAEVRGPEAKHMSPKEREEFLNRAGADPYDTYHGEKIAPSLRSSVLQAEAQAKAEEKKSSAEMQSFLKHMKLQAGIAGPLAPMMRHQLSDSYAMPNVNLPIANDTSLTNLQKVLSDFDWHDRKMANTVAVTYPQGTNLLALLLCGGFWAAYYYQRDHHWMDWYDEFVGLDVRRVPQMEEPVLFIITLGIMRVLWYHPACVLVVVLTRMTRIMRGRPLGPP